MFSGTTSVYISGIAALLSGIAAFLYTVSERHRRFPQRHRRLFRYHDFTMSWPNVCQEKITSLVCGHSFHTECVQTYCTAANKCLSELPCPVCKHINTTGDGGDY